MINKSKSSFIKIFIASLMSVLFLISAFVPTFKTTNAEGIFCGETFAGALKPGVSKKVLDGAGVLPNLGSRTYTVQELFGDSLSIARFNGEYEGDFLIGKKDEGLEAELSDSKAIDRLKKRGESYGCIPATIFSTGTNIIISLTSQVNNFVTMVTTTLFDADFPQKDTSDLSAKSKAGNKLTEIVGGEEGKNNGIINDLAKSIYFPLMILAGAFAGLYIFYNAVVKRQIRESISSFGWVALAILFGVFVATKPTMVARAPQAVTSTVLGCLVDGLNGGNCLTGSSSGNSESSFIAKGCKSNSSSASVDEKAALNVNSLSCGIWKAMTLNAWTKAQFGYNFDELYTSDPPSGGSTYDLGNSGVDGSLFCIQTGSASSINEARRNGATFDSGDTICNIAAAQLAIQSGMNEDESMEIRKAIAKVALHDPIMFNSWGLTNGGQATAITAAIGTIFALMAILSISIRAHIYSFLATISTAFAPLYALLAIHPGKGRRMFLGWLEEVIGYILKFIFTATIVLVTVMLFGALMKNMTGMTSLVACIILSLTMKVYQKDFVAFVGQADLGGAKVSQNMGDVLNKKLDKGQESVKKAGGLVAGTLAGEKLSSLKTGQSAHYGQAMGDAVSRSMSRGRGVVGSAARQYRRGSNLKKSQQKEADRQQQRAQESAEKTKAVKDSLNTMNQNNVGGSIQNGGKVKMPNLIGSDLSIAENTLSQNGLSMNITSYEETSDMKQLNKIASQSIKPGTDVMVGMIVDLSVFKENEDGNTNNSTSSQAEGMSLPPIPDEDNPTTEANNNVPDNSEEKEERKANVVKVPSMINSTLTMAQTTLSNRGFTNVSVERKPGGNKPDIVMAQSPAAGTPCAVGTPIKLTVSEQVVINGGKLPNLEQTTYSDQNSLSYDSNGAKVSSSSNIIEEHENSPDFKDVSDKTVSDTVNTNFVNNVLTKEEKELVAKIELDMANGKQVDMNSLPTGLTDKLNLLSQQDKLLKDNLKMGTPEQKNTAKNVVKEMSLKNSLQDNYKRDMEGMNDRDRELMKQVIEDASKGVKPAQNVLKQYDNAMNNLTLLDKNKKELDADVVRNFVNEDRHKMLEEYSSKKGYSVGDKPVMDNNTIDKLNHDLKDIMRDSIASNERVLINKNLDSNAKLNINKKASSEEIAKDTLYQITSNPTLGVLNNKEKTIDKAMEEIEKKTLKPEKDRIQFDTDKINQELGPKIEELYKNNKAKFDQIASDENSKIRFNNVKNESDITEQILNKIKENPAIIIKGQDGNIDMNKTMEKITKDVKDEEKNQNSTTNLQAIRDELDKKLTERDLQMDKYNFEEIKSNRRKEEPINQKDTIEDKYSNNKEERYNDRKEREISREQRHQEYNPKEEQSDNREEERYNDRKERESLREKRRQEYISKEEQLDNRDEERYNDRKERKTVNKKEPPINKTNNTEKNNIVDNEKISSNQKDKPLGNLRGLFGGKNKKE